MDPEGLAFTPDEVSGEASLRLYRLRVDRFEVHVGAREPGPGTRRDRRVVVDPTGGR